MLTTIKQQKIKMQKLGFMLAKEWTEGMKVPREFKDKKFAPEGWLMSEKKDGLRARYNPETKGFISRNNKPYNAPSWFIESMPNVHLDGELFCGRGNFEKMGGARRKVPLNSDWFNYKFHVYDTPEINATFHDRYNALEKVVKVSEELWNMYKKDLGEEFENVTCPLVLTKHYEVESIEQMKEYYQKVLDLGGEGIMLKNPSSDYENKRSNHLLKVKPDFDREAIIVDYKDGTGKYEGKLGAFICKQLINHDSYMTIDNIPDHEFATSGMNDEVRDNYKLTHPIGTVITFKCSGYTNSGKPRFARYLRIRDDVIIKEPEKMMVDSESDEIVQKCMHIFKRMAVYEKANGQGFKAKAYTNAIDQLKSMKDNDLTPESLIKVKGIGKSMIEKIQSIVQTGTCPQYEKIKDFKDPKETFMQIHAVGSVKANQLLKAGFQTIQDLKDSENIEEYLNEPQMKGLKWYEDSLQRIPREEIVDHEKYLKEVLNEIEPTAELTIAGSYRRGKMDSGDIDMLINTPNVKNNKIYKKFIEELFKRNYLLEELSNGQKKFMGICKLGPDNIGRRIDIMFTKPQEYPFAILYFTGSKDFNIKMRGELLKKEMSLNEYGIKDKDKKNVKHDCKTEKDVFKYLGYDYIEPENR